MTYGFSAVEKAQERTQTRKGKKNFIQQENHSTKAIIDDITIASISDHNLKKLRSKFLSIKNSDQQQRLKYFFI